MGLISDKDMQQFKELGYFVTPPAFPEATLAAMRADFDRMWRERIAEAEKAGIQKDIDLARNRVFIGQTHTRSEVVKEFVKSPIYLEACSKFIGPDADLYYNQAVIKAADKGKHFGWHQDSGYKVTKPLEYITCWTAIGRSSLDMGCIWVLPKSHKLGLVKHAGNDKDSSYDAVMESEEGAIPVEMEAGQVAIFSSLLLHKSGPNTSKNVRYGFVPQYHVPGVVGEDGVQWGDQFPVLRGGQRA
ncbi:MAG: phytanoyl-CoA dioxygenase family protein [candidate division FCPU426 bacterium]